MNNRVQRVARVDLNQFTAVYINRSKTSSNIRSRSTNTHFAFNLATVDFVL